MSQIAAPMPPQAAASPRRQQPAGREGLLMLAWILSIGGAALAVVGFFLAEIELGPGQERVDVRLGGVAAVVGGILLVVGLTAASYRSIALRRDLGEDRYRGPSILILLAMASAVGALISLPFLDRMTAIIASENVGSDLETFLLLVSTAAGLVGTALVFVIVPRALPGIGWRPRGIRHVAWSLLLGVLIGGPAWILGALLSVLASALLSGLGQPTDQQIVEQLVPNLNPVLAAVAIVIVAPIAEEIFFRGVVFNAWLREYGFWVALIGSSLIFALIHVSLYAFLPILMLALILGYVYHQTRSLLTVIAVHATFNAISTALLFLAPDLV